MNPRKAVKSFIVNNNQLLLIKRADDDVHRPGIWEIPGGRLDKDENMIDGLVRETKEETNLDIEIIKELNKQHFIRDDGDPIDMTIFLCKPISSKVCLSKEHSDFKWVNINKAKENISHFFHKEVDLLLGTSDKID